MVQFSCATCEISLEDQEMLKHLSQTRHKTVIYTPSGEQVECEKCHDSNIHVLTLIRYGGTDMGLLCQVCFAKEEDKPSTQYTIQNGSILKNFENYLRVRDLSCLLCSSENHLNTYTTNSTLVFCSKCIKEKKLDQANLVNENDEKFLYVLLGIKEPTTKSSSDKSSKRSRKVGRGKGKPKFGKGKPKRSSGSPRPNTSTPSDNKETLRSFQALAPSAVKKIRPEDEKNLPPSQPVTSSSSNPSNSSKKPSGKSSFSGPKSGGSKSTSNKTSKSANGHASSSKPKQADKGPKNSKGNTHGSISQVTDSLARLQVNSSSSGSKKPDLKKPSKKDSKPSNKSSNNEKNDDQFKRLDDLIEKRKDPNYVSPTPKQNKPAGNKNSKASDKPSDKALKNNKPADQPSGKASKNKNDKVKKSDAKPSEKNNEKSKKPDSKTSEKKKDQKPSNNPKGKSKTIQTQTPPVSKVEASKKEPKQTEPEDYEEFEHVPKYLSKQPKLSYDSLDEYFKEMCYHLYLEEKLATDSITNFQTEWHKDNKQLFKLTIPYTEEIENLVPEKLRKVGKLPFSMNQSLFVARSNDKDNIWDCFIKDLSVTRGRGPRRNIELLLELYKWNNASEFPVGSQSLSILPCSATISRILFAMARIENPKFIAMLLGKTPIRQLNFNNRITFTTDHFNPSQKSAIQHVLNNSITVLQGPPGTGKTSTIYELILQLFKNLKTYPILVVAASNVAIDNIAEKLKKDTDINVLRIVSAEKEREYNDKHHLHDICLHHQVFAKLPLKFQETAKDLKFNRNPVSQNQYKKLLTTQNSINEKLIAQAQVILTTSVVAGGYQLKSVKKLPVVIMDESTQSTEASTLIPLSMPGVDRFVFVGDDKQLSSFSDVPYLEQSLFERVLKNGTYTNPHMLNIQYRMHPSISEFPIKKFYNNLLEDGVTDEQRRIPGIEPLTFIDYGSKFKEEKVSNFRRGGGYTYTNKGEAELILRVLKEMIFVKNIKKEDISIITPYSAQRDLIATLIQKDSLVNPTNEPIEEEVDEDSLTRKKPTTIKTIVKIMISSIDAFQGREKDIIIFSCVRSNEENKIGFVKDARRLNVALTRARSGLVLVGNKDNMSKGDPLWKDLSDHLEEKKFVRTEENYFAT